MQLRTTAVWLAGVFLACAPAAARAQTLPAEPFTFASGRVTVGGDVSAAVGSSDPGFFNYTDYARSALRLFRIDVTAAVKAGPHFSVLTEVRTENFAGVQPYALFLRIRPWSARDFDVQIGRVPPTFGAFARRSYPSDNPLIGYPLAYQYLTSLRADALPASVDELLRKRSLGWEVGYSIGDATRQAGVPLVTAFQYDTGVQAHAAAGMVHVAAAVTAGTLSEPRFAENNDGGQTAARVELRPVAGLIAGASLARGPFVARSAARAASADAQSSDLTQSALGFDVEYSRNFYLVRVETIASAWRVPIGGAAVQTLRALATSVEGRYKLRPGLYAAARYDHLGFGAVTGATFGTIPWDAPVSRLEIGGGYSIQRNVLLKVAVQRNTRDGGVLVRTANLGAVQIVYWF